MAKQTKAGKSGKEPNIPDSELEVMRMLWRERKATARKVWSLLQDEGSKWTYATVNTLLQRLEQKGYATSDKTQMTYVYSPKKEKKDVINKKVKTLVDKLYDGAGGQLAMHVLKQQRLTPEERNSIQEILDASKK
jgi:predicted transcriptional regulator